MIDVLIVTTGMIAGPCMIALAVITGKADADHYNRYI